MIVQLFHACFYGIEKTWTLALDLLSPGAGRMAGPWLEAVLEHSFQDALPWIHATLWRGLESFAAP